MVMTKEVIEKVGAFDMTYGRYGFEHCDYTRRCKLAGLCQPAIHDAHPFILEADLYFRDLNIKTTIDPEDYKNLTTEANKVYMDFNPNKIYIPFPEGDY